MCGDGVVQPGEACDDGNTSDGDGCSAACEVECGFACEKKSEGLRIFSTCTRHCGDGVVQWELGEECDDTSKCCDGCRLAPSHNAEVHPLVQAHAAAYQHAGTWLPPPPKMGQATKARLPLSLRSPTTTRHPQSQASPQP